ncbi:pseudouridine synthase [Cellulosilyticum sp. I15G10I2]|uniref:pseudouridine synthase n=1 Tax=Cellulosilyticum sp. I15G10I2 TaxID=1892843 RepID=UPI00085CD527|nr:pseudouridine synthase [Cellulosilyticum sp. I15G10I2]
MRLQKYLASCGVASRRKCEEYILQGRVQVNGVVITELGTKVNEDDCIMWDDKVIKDEQSYQYYALNKPIGYVTTVKDEKDRATVLDFFQEIGTRIYPIGRLDYNTSGLLLLTNDGDLTYGLTHPKYHVNKTYHVKVKGKVEGWAIEKLRKGVIIDGKITAPAMVEIIEGNQSMTYLSMTIHEGRNRQIRKMCEAVGHSVLKLMRVSIGEITLDDLLIGQYRKLTEDEVNYLKKIGGIHV